MVLSKQEDFSSLLVLFKLLKPFREAKIRTSHMVHKYFT